MNAKLIITIFVCIFSLNNIVNAETLTFDTYLQSLKSHPIFLKGSIDKSIIEEEQQEIQTAEDWLLKSSAFYSHEEPSFAVAGPERTDAVKLSGSVERIFWNNGGSLQAGFQTTRANMKINPVYGIPSTYYENALTVTYSMPLLKNKKGLLHRLQHDLKNFDIDISISLAIEEQENFLTTYALRYVDWVFLLEQRKIIEERIIISKELLTNNIKKRDANLIDNIDVIRSENALSIAEQNLLLINSAIESLVSELSEIITNIAFQDVDPILDVYQKYPIIDFNTENSNMLSESRILKTIKTQVEQIQYLKIGLVEDNKTSLNLITQLGLQNAEDKIVNSIVLDKPNFSIGLQLALPLGKRSNKSKTYQADLKIEKLKNQLDNLKRNLSSSLSKVIVQLNQYENILDKNKDQIQIAKKKTTEEIKLYNNGRGQLTFVILSRDEEQAAELSYLTNAVIYQKLRIQYYALTDQLIAM